MPIAGAVVIPINKGVIHTIQERLNSINGIEVQGMGEKGIAVVIEAEDIDGLKQVSEEINGWEEVIDFQLSYLNWEDKV